MNTTFCVSVPYISLNDYKNYTLCNYIPNFESLVPNEQFIKLMAYEKILAKYEN